MPTSIRLSLRVRDCVNGMASLRVTQGPGVVDQWRGPFVRPAVKLNQYTPDIKQETVDGTQEPSRLRVLGGSATGSNHSE